MAPLRVQDLPRQLTSASNWVGWRMEKTKNSEKTTKVPYNLRTGRKASTTQPADWLSFDEAVGLLDDSYDGLGFVFTSDLNMTGIDLDDCILPNGEIKPWAAKILNDFKNTYCEISPSGTGVKIWAHDRLPGTGLKVYVDSKGSPVIEDHPDRDGAIEMYDRGRYFTVTGQRMGVLDVA